MFYYAIVDDKTGEFHNNCPDCGISGYGDRKDVLNLDLPNHIVVEVSNKEKAEIDDMYYEVKRKGRKVRVDNFEDLEQSELVNMSLKHKNKIDIKKAKRKIKDRTKQVAVNLFGVHYAENQIDQIVMPRRTKLRSSE